jgi:hypothetical protein
MSQWLWRDSWPADPYGLVYLLRAVDATGAATLGERWQPPAQPTEETALAAWLRGCREAEALEIDRTWIASKDFLDTSRLVAERCASGKLEAVLLDREQVIAMGANEWALEDSREGDACFRMGHVFLADRALPVFIRRASLEKFIAGLGGPSAPQDTQPPAISEPVPATTSERVKPVTPDSPPADIEPAPTAQVDGIETGAKKPTVRRSRRRRVVAREAIDAIWGCDPPEHLTDVEVVDQVGKWLKANRGIPDGGLSPDTILRAANRKS